MSCRHTGRRHQCAPWSGRYACTSSLARRVPGTPFGVVENEIRAQGEVMLVVSRQFRATTRKMGLDLTFHGLRHGHASLMLAAGEHLKVVSEQLGHSTIGIAGDLYTHVAPAVRREAANKLDTLLASFIQPG